MIKNNITTGFEMRAMKDVEEIKLLLSLSKNFNFTPNEYDIKHAENIFYKSIFHKLLFVEGKFAGGYVANIPKKDFYYNFLFYQYWNNQEYYCLEEISLFKEYRNRGFGSIMLHDFIANCNSKKLALFVDKSNKKAIHLYELNGFKKIKKFKCSIKKKVRYAMVKEL